MKHIMTSILAAVFMAASMSANAIVIIGNIADTDHLTTDNSTNIFYVDYFDIMVSANTTLELSLQAFGDLHPYLLVVDNTGQANPLLPAANWESPIDIYNSTATLFTGSNSAAGLVEYTLNALAGVLYQVGLTSNTYFDLDPSNSVGDYNFNVTGASGAAAPNDLKLSQIGLPVAVPAPSPIGLTGLGLMLIVAFRMQRIMRG